MHRERVAWRRVVDAYACPTCTAGPGEDCVSATGHPKHEPHADRSRLAAAHDWRMPDDPWLADIICDSCCSILRVDADGFYIDDDNGRDCPDDPRGHVVDGYERAP